MRVFFSRFKENESETRANKSPEKCFEVHSICLSPTLIYSPWTQKKDMPSLIVQKLCDNSNHKINRFQTIKNFVRLPFRPQISYCRCSSRQSVSPTCMRFLWSVSISHLWDFYGVYLYLPSAWTPLTVCQTPAETIWTVDPGFPFVIAPLYWISLHKFAQVCSVEGKCQYNNWSNYLCAMEDMWHQQNVTDGQTIEKVISMWRFASLAPKNLIKWRPDISLPLWSSP